MITILSLLLTPLTLIVGLLRRVWSSAMWLILKNAQRATVATDYHIHLTTGRQPPHLKVTFTLRNLSYLTVHPVAAHFDLRVGGDLVGHVDGRFGETPDVQTIGGQTSVKPKKCLVVEASAYPDGSFWTRDLTGGFQISQGALSLRVRGLSIPLGTIQVPLLVSSLRIDNLDNENAQNSIRQYLETSGSKPPAYLSEGKNN